MIPCIICGERPAAHQIGICAACLREDEARSGFSTIHAPVRESCGLPGQPPQSPGGTRCLLCVNECSMAEGEWGYCGLRTNENGRMHNRFPARSALAHAYRDPLPTNCCASWFCPGAREHGANLAVFFYGCNFDCLFCQNAAHKNVATAPVLSEDKLVEWARSPEIQCVCYFGGSPEPQLPFALRASRRIISETGGQTRVCWEWNGAGNPRLVDQAARLSEESGGVVKFDLKAYHPAIHRALTGSANTRVLENFRRVAGLVSAPDVLTATTLLVPHYVDVIEVEAIASFIAGIDPDIPYSLLVFHPDFALRDLPITPRSQVDACREAALRHLSRVHVGNLHLLL
jgi:pyruvate formate lyase activating enzyme